MNKFFLAAAFATLVSSTALAQDRSFNFYNETSRDIQNIYVKNIDDTRWGRDLLGRDYLYSGDGIGLEPDTSYGYCRFDLMIVFDDGARNTIDDVDLCAITELSIEGRRNHLLYDASY